MTVLKVLARRSGFGANRRLAGSALFDHHERAFDAAYALKFGYDFAVPGINLPHQDLQTCNQPRGQCG